MTGLTGWMLAIGAGIAAALLGYGMTAIARPRALVPALLRVVAVASIIALLLDLAVSPAAPPSALVAVDRSASMQLGGDGVTRAALDSARAIGGEAVGFGDTALAEVDAAPSLASRAAPAVRRATAETRPLVVITDGELDDGESLGDAPPGSRVIVVPRPASLVDRAVTDLELPAAVTAGDTLEVAVRLATRGAVPAARLVLMLDEAIAAERTLPAVSAGDAQRVELSVVVPAGEATLRVRAVLVQPADAVPANDTVAVAIARERTARVVIASTAPDADVRDLVSLLRASASPAPQAFYRVAPGRWVRDGTLASIDEATVRAAVRGASLAVLHGDSAWAGATGSFAARALFLIVPPGDDARDGYVRPPPASPLQGALSGLGVDSLPPLLVSREPGDGVVALTAGATPASSFGAAILTLVDATPRRAVLAAAGWSRWRRRGGASAAAFQALIGAPLDWLAAARPRAPMPAPPPGVLRAGTAIRFARGMADTASLALVRDGDRRVHRDTLDFRGGAGDRDAVMLDAGTWRGRVGGAPIVLVVNAAGELLPRPVTVRSGPLGGVAERRTRGARAVGWLYLAAALALAAEWLLRRRAGLR